MPAPTAPGLLVDDRRHWERLGFVDDPYYGLHLPVAPISLTLFVGRDQDRSRLREFLASYPSGMTMVEGPPGVGKTSLVNIVQQELYAGGRRFPFFDVVETTEDTTRESFLLTVLSAAVSSLELAFGATQLAGDAAYQSARTAVTRTLQYATTMNLTLGLPKVLGGSAGRSPVPTTPLAPTAQALIDLLRGVVDSVAERGFDGMIVPVNNLDTLGADAVIQFLNVVRDACSAIEGVHWVFIGGAYLFEVLEDRTRRVSERFTSNPIALEPLGWSEVSTALERRRRAFAVDAESAELPISPRVAELIHEAGGGELRFTFTRLSRTVLEFAWKYPSERRIPDELAMVLLRAWGERHLRRVSLTAQEQRVAERLIADGHLRARDHQSLGINTSQQMSRLLVTLERKGYARRGPASDDDGRFGYRPSPAVVLANAASV